MTKLLKFTEQGEFVYCKGTIDASDEIGNHLGHIDYRLHGFKPEHFIAGGFVISVIFRSDFNDIDVWSPLELPIEFTRESPYAYNIDGLGKPIQFMKIKPNTPMEFISNFDADIVKACIYNIVLHKEYASFTLVLHKVLWDFYKTKVFKEQLTFLKFGHATLSRMYKYSMRFAVPCNIMYTRDCILQAILLSNSLSYETKDILRTSTPEQIEEILSAVPSENWASKDNYALLEHLEGLFPRTHQQSVERFFDLL